jgi:hypothetical protein
MFFFKKKKGMAESNIARNNFQTEIYTLEN